MFLRLRTYQRTVYRPGEVCQWDLWETVGASPGRSRPGPPGVGGGLLLGVLARSRGRACVQQGGAGRAVGDDPLRVAGRRVAGVAGVGSRGVSARRWRPTDAGFAAFCGQLPVGWVILRARRSSGEGCGRAAAGLLETNFEPGRRFANHLDFQDCSSTRWFEKANARTHKTLRERPIDRLLEEREVMRPLPACEPDLDRRWVIRVAPDPHVRFDTNDYSLDPSLVGRRVEVRVSQREIIAVALDTGELACRHERCFAEEQDHHRAGACSGTARAPRQARRSAS